MSGQVHRLSQWDLLTTRLGHEAERSECAEKSSAMPASAHRFRERQLFDSHNYVV
jgi:hypothetical protein